MFGLAGRSCLSSSGVGVVAAFRSMLMGSLPSLRRGFCGIRGSGTGGLVLATYFPALAKFWVDLDFLVKSCVAVMCGAEHAGNLMSPR